MHLQIDLASASFKSVGVGDVGLHAGSGHVEIIDAMIYRQTDGLFNFFFAVLLMDRSHAHPDDAEALGAMGKLAILHSDRYLLLLYSGLTKS